MEWYHVLNRGVDKRQIVLDDNDRVRFIHDLFVFNDQQHALHMPQPDRKELNVPRKLLVHLHAFCLMGNHYHLLLSEATSGGIPAFMKKLNMGYTKYFNDRHKRSGALWQGKYKKILFKQDAHFMYIPYYIHLNALDFSMPEWRQGKVRSTTNALKTLQRYRWSSHLDYLGENNFPSITERECLARIIGTKQRYKKEIARIITDPDLASVGESIE